MFNLLKLSFFVCLAILMSACRDGNDIRSLSENEVYFFYQNTCPHCHDAAKYIKEKHPGVKIKALDVKMPGNQKLFASAVKSYEIKALPGTPLICFGDEYIMGWSEKDEKKLDVLIEKYNGQ